MNFYNPPYWELEKSDIEINLGKNVRIEPGVILGYQFLDKPREASQTSISIGDGTIVRTGAIIYPGVIIGKNCMINHYVTIRENTVIGDDTIIGSYTQVEGNIEIGNGCSVWTHSHLTAYSKVGNNVFIGPNFVSLNDPVIGYKRRNLQHKGKIGGPIIEDNVRISGGVTIQPGVTIGEDAIVGTGSIVTKDVEPRTIVIGVPAKKLRNVPEDEWVKKC